MKILLIALTKDFLRAKKPKKPKGTIFLRFPSLALANIAALTPKEDKVIVIDEQISPVNYNLDVDLVAISVNTSVVPRAYEIADKFRERGVKVVFGGIHPSSMQKESLEHADSIVAGDADGVWEELLNDFKNNKLKKKYVNNQERDLKYLPTPKWEIFKNMGYVNTNFVETSRGCTHNCSFCSTSPFYKHMHRVKPIENVIRDIKRVKSFPKKFIFFVDDNIIGDREYAKKLFKALKPLNIYWISQATVNIGEDEELVRLAAESGCFGLFLGFESISKQSIGDINKAHNKIENYKKTIRLLHKYGIAIEAGFIFGLDNDNLDTFKSTLRFLNETNMDSFLAIYLTPIPGTKMYDIFKKENRLLTDNYTKYDFRHIVFEPKNMSTREIYRGVSWISGRFHSKRLVRRRLRIKFLDLLRHPSIRRLLGFVGLLAISLAFRKRIKDLSKDGTYPRSFRNI